MTVSGASVAGPNAIGYGIRAAVPSDVPRLRDIERAAGRCFRDIAMAAIADDEPLPADVLDGYREAGRCWVAVDVRDVPVGYLIVDSVDGNLHIEQVSVHPDHARRGLGRLLIDHVTVGARAGGVPAVTLTTFRDVAWNAPYYARCGFRILPESDWGPELRGIRRREAEHGLDRWPRVCMLRETGQPGTAPPH